MFWADTELLLLFDLFPLDLQFSNMIGGYGGHHWETLPALGLAKSRHLGKVPRMFQ